MEQRTIAAVDLGTNSVHLVVARVKGQGPDVSFDILTREKEMVRLGTGGGDMKHLDDDAIDRAVDALRRCRSIADGTGAEIRVVATSAVREAENAEVLIERSRDEAGLEIEVVSGREEARLIHLGVLQAVPTRGRRHLVVDIGGGSTELVIGQGEDQLVARSLKLGAIRLTNRFFAGAVLHPGAVGACRTHVRSMLVPFVRLAAGHDLELAIGSSGTIEALAQVEHARREGEPARHAANLTLTADGLAETIDVLIGAHRLGRRIVPDGLDERRADIILAGALILEGVMRELGVEELTVADAALREGVLLDTVLRTEGGTLDHLRDLRRRGVEQLLDACDDDPDHARQCALLATRIFDETTPVHGHGGHERELLEFGTLLANVGLIVSHDRHHRHSYYVIRHSDRLVGFTAAEIDVIALVARYHRKSAPRRRHDEFAALSGKDRRLVRLLAGIARVAIALDRGHRGAVHDVDVDVDDDRVVIGCDCAGSEADLELYTAAQRSDLLARALDRDIVVVPCVTSEDR